MAYKTNMKKLNGIIEAEIDSKILFHLKFRVQKIINLTELNVT